MLELLRLPEVIHRAADLRSPNHLAEYSFELAGAFNRFYDACHILSEEDATTRSSWLTLSTITLEAVTLALRLLGIETPTRM